MLELSNQNFKIIMIENANKLIADWNVNLIVTLVNSLVVSHKTEPTTAVGSSDCTPGLSSQKNEDYVHTKHIREFL